MAKKTVMVIGSTGLVGGQLLYHLNSDSTIDRIVCLVRTPTQVPLEKVSFHVVNFMDLDRHHELFDGVSHVFCCIGTTMKKAKSKEQFQIVDHYIPKVVARLSHDHFVTSFSLVSSVGANVTSRSFYLSVKGKIESDLQKVGFKTLLIYRPSLLHGPREEVRLGEVLLAMVLKLFAWGIPKKYRPTNSDRLASMMATHSNDSLSGVHIFESDMIL